MATDEAQRITDPSQIQEADLSIGLSNLAIETPGPVSSSQPHTRQAMLHLLQPLAAPAMLAACRNPGSRVVRFPDGRASDAVGPEYLDISALSKAWRQALAKVSPISWLTFNLSLPKPESEGEGEDAFQKVYWDTDTPDKGHYLAVVGHDVITLIITIATTTRVRAQGDVRFEVVYDESGASLRHMKLLKEQLLAITGARGKEHCRA
ncbi:hypothetical protein N7474_003015 [Penicillium riverlandense]|uniref:uncharacterized protein n=1 Tax=Penicillium riverlandense TaxID=1903569 RepID=UPI0025481CBC|nr:uncharacterized protein N7474_003015 [Penicillium riverlandense]KAJ5825877.1 hypothetical protein N7474_003015 [Penicillium riverlandense]